MIVQRVLEVLILCVMVKVVVEMRVIDSVYVHMSVSVGGGFSEERVMSLGVCGMDGVEVL